MSTNPETEPGRPPVEQTQIKRIEYYEGRNFHPLKTSLFVLTILISLLFGFIKDSSNVTIYEGLEKCHPVQFAGLGLAALVTVFIQVVSMAIVIKEQKVKREQGFQAAHEVEFTVAKTVFLVFCGFLIGLMANILGLGGGFVIFPMLISIGVSPLVSSACTMYLILLSKIVAAIFSFLTVYFLPGYSFLTVALVCLSIIFFIKVMDEIIKK